MHRLIQRQAMHLQAIQEAGDKLVPGMKPKDRMQHVNAIHAALVELELALTTLQLSLPAGM
jgi:hypothetical protein